MKLRLFLRLCLLAAVASSVWTTAQDSAVNSSTSAAAVVPGVINYNGVLTDLNGKPLSGIQGVTFLLYSSEDGGNPLWMETQNITPSKNGQYTVTLGVTTAQGLPSDLFANGEARWLGVQVVGQPELPRVLLVSVPYSMKAGDAQTLGGLPASAFMLANQTNATAATAASSSKASEASTKSAPPPTNPDVTGKGTAGYIPVWDTTSDIIDSVMFEKSSDIGIGTIAPAATLDVNGKGDVRDTLTLFPKTTDNTLAVSGTAFNISSTGAVTFIAGQKFPGAGTVTSVASGAGLTGGPITGSGTLSIKTGGVTNAMLVNSKVTLNSNTAGGLTTPGAMTLGDTYTIGLKPCTANQVLEYSGTVWNCVAAATGTVTSVGSGAGLTGGPITGSGSLSIASGGVTNAMLQHDSVTVTAGTDLTGGGTATLGGTAVTLNLNTAAVPTLAASNTFTSNQTISGPSSAVSLDVNSSGGIGDPQVELIQNNTTDFARLRLTDSGSTNYWDVAGFVGTSGPVLNFWNGGVGLNLLQIFPTSVQANANLYANNTAGLGDGDGVDAYGTFYGVYASSSTSDGVVSYGNYDGGYFNGPSAGTYSENDTDGTFYTAAYGFEFGSFDEDIGVYGYAASTDGAGVYGQDTLASATGAGVGYPEAGVWGDSGNSGAWAVLGTADDGNALEGYNNSSSYTTLYVQNNGSGGTGTILQAVGNGGMCTADVTGSFGCTGSVAAVASVNGGTKVALSAIHSAENWFEDAGSGQLSGGQTVVNIESVFGETVNTGVEYHVFLTPNGDCKGLYVAQKSPTSFVVKELGGGTSNIAFDYRIMAKRIGFETVRLADKTQQMTPKNRATKSIAKAIPSAREIQKQTQEHAKRRTAPAVASPAVLSGGKKK
jgi:hypothetical protein